MIKSIADRIIDGELKSPYIPMGENEYPAEDAIYVDMRITGTGKTLRPRKIDGQEQFDELGNMIEDVYLRPEADFLSDFFIKQCNGLPVTIQHPEDNFHMGNIDFFIGTIIAPYVKGKEVWGVARIYDSRFFDAIKIGVKSTSPSVISDDVLQPDGSYSEVFKSINHVALVSAGHWDIVAARPAIRMDEGKIQLGASSMAETPKNDKDIVERVSELEKKIADIISAEKREDHPELKGDGEKGGNAKKDSDTKPEDKEDTMKKDEGTDKRKLIDEVAGIMKTAGASDEEIRTAIGKMEKMGYDKSSEGSKDDEEKEEEEKKETGKEEEKKDEISKIKQDLEETKAALTEFKKVDKAKNDALAIAVNTEYELEKRNIFDQMFTASLKMDKANGALQVLPSSHSENIVSYLSRILISNQHLVLDEEGKGVCSLLKSGVKLTEEQLPLLRKAYQSLVSKLVKDDKQTLHQDSGITEIYHNETTKEYKFPKNRLQIIKGV